MNEKSICRIHARVTGRVQGVGFRYFVLGEAETIGLTGWVRNRRDGSVEVIAEGEKEQLSNLVLSLERGPRSSIVNDVKVEWLEGTGEFSAFTPRSTI